MKCYGADISQWYVDNCPFPLIKPKMGVIVNNKIPCKNDMFEFVLMHQTIEHIPEADIYALLRDIKRTMKKIHRNLVMLKKTQPTFHVSNEVSGIRFSSNVDLKS